MVKLNKIYTKTGDDGTTGLVNGPRRSKADLRIDAFGHVDETNAAIGLARLETNYINTNKYQANENDLNTHYDHTENCAINVLDAMLFRIQNDLFDLGADLATPLNDEKKENLRITTTQVDRLEKEIDYLNKTLSPLTSFVLPGGTKLAAHLHLARTIARRSERAMVALHLKETLQEDTLHYINRLSDFLFVAARHANNKGHDDVLWVPGKNR
ncbi:cob(I)yrinic acid a,c-diamide adenosyltransferase [Bartonella tamiae]|uniref:Corrinoid adenosyltransferase n=1 Tax=Bartonella tamiae Th239 TaxID=1094558 RepID=J1K0Q2_9HYPH|nr:cob(I)yrinic acid a,c-diamide adenosyltransferase [Bartonella tamiae]EJF90992.1 ATP:cob(I)alamin adenosyltransferase [Bartonella tamiae Th239]EJF93343.1 ATP:cob(I)alamin adenosyltransferase [Bartonella tamiae Th307]